MTPTYDHVALTVRDIDRSLDFYGTHFGMKLFRRDKPHSGPLVEQMTGVVGGELLAAFATNGRLIMEFIQFIKEGGERTEALPANQIGSSHLGFYVPDVREAYRTMGEAGVRFNGAPVVGSRNNWSVMMLDPDGFSIELREGSALPPEVQASLG